MVLSHLFCLFGKRVNLSENTVYTLLLWLDRCHRSFKHISKQKNEGKNTPQKQKIKPNSLTGQKYGHKKGKQRFTESVQES